MDTLTNQPIPSPHYLYGLFVPINWSQYPLCNLNIFFHNQLSTTVPPIHPILNQQIHMLIKDCKLCAKMFKPFLRVRNVFKLILSVSIHKIIIIKKNTTTFAQHVLSFSYCIVSQNILLKVKIDYTYIHVGRVGSIGS